MRGRRTKTEFTKFRGFSASITRKFGKAFFFSGYKPRPKKKKLENVSRNTQGALHSLLYLQILLLSQLQVMVARISTLHEFSCVRTVKNVSCNVSWRIDWRRRFIPWPQSCSNFTPPHFFPCGLAKNYVRMCKNNSEFWPICKNLLTR